MTNEPIDEESSSESVSNAFREVVRTRLIILVTVIVDSLLVAVLAYVFLLLHYAIGDVNRLGLVDKVVIVGLQVIGAMTTIGVMFGYLVRDLIVTTRRLRRDYD